MRLVLLATSPLWVPAVLLLLGVALVCEAVEAVVHQFHGYESRCLRCVRLQIGGLDTPAGRFL